MELIERLHDLAEETMREIKCPVCKLNYHRREYENRGFNVFRCANGHEFIFPSLSEVGQMENYECDKLLSKLNPILKHYYKWPVSKRGYRTMRRCLDVLRQWSKGYRLCDVGCGNGTFVAEAHKKGFEAFGIDSSKDNRDRAKQIGVEVYVGNFLEIDILRKQDAVTMFDFLEHFQDPCEVIKKVKSILKERGVLQVAVPCYPNVLSIIAGWLYRLGIRGPIEKMYVKEHTTYWSEGSLNEFLVLNGFTVVDYWKENTDLSRYALPWYTKVSMHIAFAIGTLLHKQNRLYMTAVLDE